MIDNKFQKLIARYDEHCRRIAKATYINIAETPTERLKRVKALERDYTAWFEYYFPNYAQVPCATFHKKFAKIMSASSEVYCLLEIYRSGAKSVHANMGVPLYLYFRGELRFMLLIGETERKAQKLLSALQAQLQFNKRLANDYGARFKRGDWSAGEFLASDGARFMSLGFGQNPRGVREEEQRPDYISVDDVDNKRHINNDRLMREGAEWIFEDLMGCFNESDGATKRFVFANNNFHKNSITNRMKTQFNFLIDRAKQANSPIRHHVISVSAVKDIVSFTPSWPEKTSEEYWRKKFASVPYRSFMREYMHQHIEDGSVFRAEDMQWKPMLPLKDYDAIVAYGDLSYKNAACHKGMIVVGKKGRELHIIHTFLRQASRATLAKWLYDLYEATPLRNTRRVKYYIEGLFSMDEFVNDFDTEGDERGYYIPVRADKRPKANKYDRIEASQSFFERRNVWFNEAEKSSADQIELIDQFLAFEKGSDAPVDGPDATEGAFSILNRVTHRQNTQAVFIKRPSRRY